METTLAMIKPDARPHIPQITAWMVEKGFKITRSHNVYFTKKQVDEFYAEHVGKPFYNEHQKFIRSGACYAMVLEGDGVIQKWRDFIGPTNPRDSNFTQLRGVYGTELPRNAVHGSDSQEAADRETKIVFP